MKKILMIVAPTGFRDEELLEPKALFEEKGFQVMIASKDVKEAKGMLGARVRIDLDVSKANAADFDAVVFVGGQGSPVYYDNAKAHEIARKAFENGKILASICLATGILAKAGLVSGKKVTGWPDVKGLVEAANGKYTGKDVEVDGRMITGKGPQAARAFGMKIVELLK